MYNKVATDMNFVSREKAIAEMWKKKDIIRKSFHHRDGCERFTFFDGPPTANGKPHIGHVETRAIKDLIPRYQTMKGKSVLRKAGWDTHGLPVELEVEKFLGLDGKPRSSSTASSPSSPSARRACGSTCTSGKKCPTRWLSGWTWNIPTSPMRTTISNPNGGA